MRTYYRIVENCTMESPAEKLQGITLDGGWKVTALIPKVPGHTGGYFSVGYIVESDKGERAFLKALDFLKIISPGSPDPAKQMAELTNSFVYERDLLRQCREANLKKIIRAITDGELTIDNIQVPYIIFELADSDVRLQANKLARFDLAWAIRTMHHVATGIKQLHSREIAHQDLKPSNILLVNGVERKISDLGRSATRGCNLFHMDLLVAGDRNHAAIEGLYGYAPTEWRDRRYGSDAYQLGSLLVFMLTSLSATTLILQALDEKYRPGIWGGSYQAVLPYLEEAFQRVIEFVSKHIPDIPVKEELLQITKMLCHPNIDQRGDPISRGIKANPFNMERFVSRFDRIAKVLERGFS